MQEEFNMFNHSFQYHLENNNPVDLFQFTNSLASLSRVFEQVNGGKPRLYVRTVKEGSIIVDLVEYVGVGMLSLPEVTPLLVSFSEYLFSRLRAVLNKQPLDGVSETELRDLNNIVAPVTQDGNKLELSVVENNGNIYQGCQLVIDTTMAREIAQTTDDELTTRKQPTEDKEFTELLTISQVRSGSSDYGTMGVIDTFSKSPKRLLFPKAEEKKKISDMEDNPLKKTFFVRVRPMYSSGKLKGYSILEVIDTIIDEE